MKRALFVFSALLICRLATAQETPPQQPNITVKWAPTGLILGSISVQGEYNFGGKSSLTAKIGVPVSARHTFQYEGSDAVFNMKATSFLAGYRTYLSKKHMKGLYLEPFFKYVHQTSEGKANSQLNGRKVVMSFTNNYSGIGIGAQLGAQFFISKKIVLDLFLIGPEINTAANKFKSVETSSAIPWNMIEAGEAENDIKEFIDQFPFIRNKTKVMVDKDNRVVTADFKGTLPGFRTGISFGIAF